MKDIKKKKKSGSNIKSTLVNLGIGASLGFVIGFILIAEPGINGYGPDNSFIVFFLRFIVALAFFFAGYVIHILIHECGHLIAGSISGYKFMSFRIFSVIFIKTDDKIQRKRFSIPGTAGQCLMIPPEPVDGKYPYLLYNLGGVILNFIISGLSMVLYIYSTGLHFIPSVLLLTFAASGMFAGLMNLIPLRLGGVANDGYNIYILGKKEEARRSFRTMLLANAYLLAGMRYKDMPAEFSEIPSDFNDPLSASIAVFHYNYLNDIHDFENARAFAGRILNEADNMLELHKNALRCEILFYELIGECRKEEIERLYTADLKKFIKISGNMMSTQRLTYAIAKLMTFDDDEAARILDRFNKCSLIYPHAGEIEIEYEMIAFINKAAEARNR